MSFRDDRRRARREKLKDHLVAYIRQYPDTVPPQIAEAFLRHGKHPADLRAMLANPGPYIGAELVPENIKQMGRAIFNQHNAEYVEARDKRAARDKRQAEKEARKLSRMPR